MKESLYDRSSGIRCPKCGSQDVSTVQIGRRRRRRKGYQCGCCGYTGPSETWDESGPECKLNATELKKDQGTLKDILTEK